MEYGSLILLELFLPLEGTFFLPTVIGDHVIIGVFLCYCWVFPYNIKRLKVAVLPEAESLVLYLRAASICARTENEIGALIPLL